MQFRVDDGTLGRRMTLTGSWRPEFVAEARRLEVVELELNYAHGWKRDDLSYLPDLPFLLALDLTEYNIEDISPIHALRSLVRLNVSTYCKTAIDFSAFPALEEVGLEWRARAKSLFACVSVKRIFLNRYTGDDLTPLLGMPNLTHLNVKTPRIKSVGDSRESALAFLGIHAARGLTSLDGIDKMTRLSALEVNGCKRVSDIEPLRGLSELERLHLCDDLDIASLDPIGKHRKLREVLFYGTTSIQDGRISVLRPLGLEKVAFQDRRHYDMKRTDFPGFVQ